jgi:hypothetical protein
LAEEVILQNNSLQYKRHSQEIDLALNLLAIWSFAFIHHKTSIQRAIAAEGDGKRIACSRYNRLCTAKYRQVMQPN